MRTFTRILIVGAIAMAAACGGGDGPTSSGVDPAKQLPNLTPDEVMTMCEWSVDAQGGAGSVDDCGDGFMVTTQTVAECVASFTGATCTATVGEIEACINAIDGNGCLVFSEPSCDVLLACAQ